jgi:hypothetical protein
MIERSELCSLYARTVLQNNLDALPLLGTLNVTPAMAALVNNYDQISEHYRFCW